MIRRVLVYSLLTIGCIIAIVPFVVTILASLKTTPELVRGVLGLPKEAQWENYRIAWTQGHFDKFFLNSILVALGVVIP